MELRGSAQRVSDLDKWCPDKRNAEALCDYEKQLRTLKDEIAVLSAEKSVLQGRSDKLSQIFSFQPLFAKLVIKARLGKGKKQNPNPEPQTPTVWKILNYRRLVSLTDPFQRENTSWIYNTWALINFRLARKLTEWN